MPEQATVQYLTIYGHDSEPSDESATSGKKFEAKINPDNIKTRRSLLFNTDNRANTGYDIQQYQGYGSIELEIKLVLTDYDGNRPDSKTVKAQVDDLMKATYDYVGGIHKAPYVTVQWGSEFKFLGHLKDMSIEYQTFNSDGSSHHAEVELLFVNHISSIANAHQQNRNSPDMSHMKLIKDGDKIPLICDEIYDDPTYYIQIADLNSLTNFRSIPAGKRILFPPLIN